MRGWQAETHCLSVAACQPSYLHWGAHSAQTLQARIRLHVTLASWANKDHLSGWGFLSEYDTACRQSLTKDSWWGCQGNTRNTVPKQKKKKINKNQNNARWRHGTEYWAPLSDMIKHSSSDAQSSEHDAPPPLLLTLTSQRNQTGVAPDCAIITNSEKKMKRFSTIFPLQERQSLSACLPACFSGMSLPTWHITRALHWCRQWAISASSVIAMIWVGKSITWPPGKRRTPGRSLTPGSAIIHVFSLPVYTNLPPLSLIWCTQVIRHCVGPLLVYCRKDFAKSNCIQCSTCS